MKSDWDSNFKQNTTTSIQDFQRHPIIIVRRFNSRGSELGTHEEHLKSKLEYKPRPWGTLKTNGQFIHYTYKAVAYRVKTVIFRRYSHSFEDNVFIMWSPGIYGVWGCPSGMMLTTVEYREMCILLDQVSSASISQLHGLKSFHCCYKAPEANPTLFGNTLLGIQGCLPGAPPQNSLQSANPPHNPHHRNRRCMHATCYSIAFSFSLFLYLSLALSLSLLASRYLDLLECLLQLSVIIPEMKSLHASGSDSNLYCEYRLGMLPWACTTNVVAK